MSKLISLQKSALGVCCVLFFSVLAFGQNGSLQTDLNSLFKEYNLIRLNERDALQRAEAGNSLTITAADKNFVLNLTPNDLRSPRYRAEDTGAKGVTTLERGEVTTFKGNVAGENNSEVRLTIDSNKVEGFFEVDGKKFFIEPAANYSRSARAEDIVVYREEDKLKTESFVCESEISEKIERGKEMLAGNSVENAQGLRILEIATEADSQYVAQMGGAAQANNEILSVLNMVEGVTKREFNLSIRVVFQHTWSTSDFFDGTNSTTLLASFVTYWNTNYPQSQIPRTVAHLFSGKPNVSGYGLSYIGVTCFNSQFAYGISGTTVSFAANSLIAAHEIGHNLGARHVDAAQSCANTIMNAQLSDSTPMTFCTYSRNEIGNNLAANGGCLAQRNSTPTMFDFDADGKSDVTVFRPSNGTWYITNSGSSSYNSVRFGQDGDKIVPADYDGDGKTDIAVYRGGIWYRLRSTTNTYDTVYFGAATDIPASADFDGDGKADVAVFRPSDGVWHRLLSGSGNSYSAFQFGTNGDVPVAADFDGDGKADINVFRPSNGAWYRVNSSNGQFAGVQFGQLGDKPLIGDFDGDGKSDITVFRGGFWYILNSADGSFRAAAFGFSTDVPTPADFDGDGKTDIAVFRPSNGAWYRMESSTNSFAAAQFGAATDAPAQSCYVQ